MSLTGEDGGTITIDLPDHLSPDDGSTEATPAIASDIVDDEDGTRASRDVVPG